MYHRQLLPDTWVVSRDPEHRVHHVGMRQPDKKHYIREWRQFRDLSLVRLAGRMTDHAGNEVISSVSIGRIERGQQPYSQPIIEGLAVALDCTVEDLVSVNPHKAGEVVDLMRIIKRFDADKVQQLLKIAKAIS
jgi:transcriptional regulator with XRE-family HTH domain